MLDLLFVYGTLHPDRAPTGIAAAVRRLELLGPATVQGTRHELAGFPALKLDSRGSVAGHLFRLPPDPSVLQALDAYEDHRPKAPECGLFRRTQTTATLAAGAQLQAWVYVYNPPLPPLPETW